MRTLKLTIAYDGTRYAGWQVQRVRRQKAEGRRQKGKPTIQGTLERVLHQILQERVRVVGSGRTDAGVHALAQVAHLKTRNPLPRERLLRSLNQLLPQDVAVMRIEEVDASFHARFHTRRKRYRYRIFTGPVVPPFICPYVHHVRAPLALALMRRETALLRGRHDFRAFARVPRLRSGSLGQGSTAESREAGSGRSSFVRRIDGIQVIRRGPELQIEVVGTGFLHTMVRSIVGTLVDIGRGRLPPGTIQRMLRTGKRSLAGTTAPPGGLALVRVDHK